MTAAEPTTFAPFDYDADVQPTPVPQPAPTPAVQLGPLAGLAGPWSGPGFNTIWRPVHDPADPAQDRFLELNLTTENLDFDTDGLGKIPNRGLLQADIDMAGIRYLQRISDTNTGEGLHLEPGLWLNIPATEVPTVPPSVARLASIPHGTTIVAQGTGFEVDGGPIITPVDITPFPIGQPTNRLPRFPEQDLSTPTQFRTGSPGIDGITQDMVDNPNSVLTAAIEGQTIVKTTVLQITTEPLPIIGGGTANTAFLQGANGVGNADAATVTAIFWLETLADGTEQLQYTQTVLLNFNGLSWPHVTVATLTRPPVS